MTEIKSFSLLFLWLSLKQQHLRRRQQQRELQQRQQQHKINIFQNICFRRKAKTIKFQGKTFIPLAIF